MRAFALFVVAWGLFYGSVLCQGSDLEEVPDIVGVDPPTAATDFNDNVEVAETNIYLVGITLSQAVVDASEKCLSNAVGTETFLSNAFRPTGSADVSANVPYTLTFWSLIEKTSFRKYRQDFVDYVKVDENSLAKCVASEVGDSESSLTMFLTVEPQELRTPFDFSLPYWAIFVVSASLSVILLAAVLLLWCVQGRCILFGGKTPLYPEENYVEALTGEEGGASKGE